MGTHFGFVRVRAYGVKQWKQIVWHLASRRRVKNDLHSRVARGMAAPAALDALVQRIQQGGVREVILATNPTLEGDGTALYISNLLAGKDVLLTRLARGLPSGSVLEFANSQMLADALEGRRTF